MYSTVTETKKYAGIFTATHKKTCTLKPQSHLLNWKDAENDKSCFSYTDDYGNSIWGFHSYKEPYFLGYKDVYKQFERIVISSPLSLVITKFVGEYQAKCTQPGNLYAPLLLLLYGYTLVIWPRGSDRLRDFPAHLNSALQNILFNTIMIQPPSFPQHMFRRDHGMDNKVYHRPTHNNFYLKSSSHYHLWKTIPHFPRGWLHSSV
jgi:hypothetical protein